MYVGVHMEKGRERVSETELSPSAYLVIEIKKK